MNWSSLLAGDRFFVSPQMSDWQISILANMRASLPKDDAHVWILSSGTQSVRTVKAIGLSVEAILASSAAVNRHLASTAEDRWLRAIPHYHIGGLSIYARAHLSGAQVFADLGRWNPVEFVKTLVDKQISLISLVPTQVHDLVARRLECPTTVRAAVIGGGALDHQLYRQARTLGWPVLPSYGLTECGSQVATATLNSIEDTAYPDLEILDHVEVRLDDGRIFLKSPSLCTRIMVGDSDGSVTLTDPRVKGWLPTEDLAELRAGRLKILGRRDDVVKILGVLVPIQEVEEDLRQSLGAALSVVAVPDPRGEHRLILFIGKTGSVTSAGLLVEAYNARVPGPRRIKNVAWVNDIPRGEMGKVRKAELMARLRGE